MSNKPNPALARLIASLRAEGIEFADAQSWSDSRLLRVPGVGKRAIEVFRTLYPLKLSNPPSGHEIASRRVGAHWTQAQAAGAVYRTTRCWQKWESGDSAIDMACWELFLRKIGNL